MHPKVDIENTWTLLTTKMAPEKPGVYAFIVDSNVLYIGSTWRLRNRCSNHLVKRLLIRLHHSVSVYYKVMEDYIDYEREMILLFKPLYNKQILIPKKDRNLKFKISANGKGVVSA